MIFLPILLPRMICIILMELASRETLHQIGGGLWLRLVLLPVARGQSLARLKQGGILNRPRVLASYQAEEGSQQQM